MMKRFALFAILCILLVSLPVSPGSCRSVEINHFTSSLSGVFNPIRTGFQGFGAERFAESQPYQVAASSSPVEESEDSSPVEESDDSSAVEDSDDSSAVEDSDDSSAAEDSDDSSAVEDSGDSSPIE